MFNTSAVEYFADAATVEPFYTDADNLEGGRVYTRHLSDAREHGDVPVYVLNGVARDDTGGGDVMSEANYRFLTDNYDECPWLIRVDYTMSSGYAIVPHLIPDGEDVESVCDLILDDYPVYDDDFVTDVQVEWLGEQIDGWMSADLQSDLLEDVEDVGRGELGDIVRAWYVETERWPEFEGDSVYLHRDDWADLVKYAANKLRGA